MHRRRDGLLWALALAAAAAAVLLRPARPAGAAVCLAACAALLLALALLRGRALGRALEEARALRQALERERAAAAQALEEARAASEQALLEERESLRSLLSHSLRVPLSIIQGYAELLDGDLVQDENTRREYLGKIIQRSRYASEVLGRQLSEARSEETLALSCVQMDLLEMVRQAAADFQNSADLKGISIQILTQEERVMVEADPCQLTKVFFNLVENAVKYMGREGIITIRISSDGPLARVVVKDDGLGLDAEETRHIFELNYQGSNRSGGHGHGLYLTRRIVQAHGGDITAESSPGHGMGITITLPLRQDAAPRREGAEAEPSAACGGSAV